MDGTVRARVFRAGQKERGSTLSAASERTIAWFGLTREWSRKKRTTRSCDRNFCRQRIAMIHSKSPYSRIDDRQSRYPAVCSYRGLITASAFRELYLTRVYLLKPRSQSCSRQNNIFRALLGAPTYTDSRVYFMLTIYSPNYWSLDRHRRREKVSRRPR